MTNKELIEESLDLSVRIAKFMQDLDQNVTIMNPKSFDDINEYINEYKSNQSLLKLGNNISPADTYNILYLLDGALTNIITQFYLADYLEFDNGHKSHSLGMMIKGLNKKCLKSHPFPEDNNELSIEE